VKRLQIYNGYNIRNGHSPTEKNVRPGVLAKVNGFILVWESLTAAGAMSDLLPGNFE
jgi:hypothetical protein